MKITEHEKETDETTSAIPPPLPPQVESPFEFTTDVWFEPHPYVTNLPETSPTSQGGGF